MSKPNSFLIIILLANCMQMVAAEEAPARVKSRLEMTLPEMPVIIPPKETEPRRKSPLEPYSPKYYYKMQTEQTSPVHKTYFDEVKKKSVTLDPTRGFLYRNSGTDNLEAVLQEDSFGSLDEVEFGIAYDDGIPQSQRSNFKKVETATTSSGYKTVETSDTKQTISYEPSREMLMKSKVTGKWEAVRREFPPMIDKPKATNRESTRSNATESRYIPSTGQWQETMREPDRMPQSSTQRQSTLGEQVAGGVKRQLENTTSQNFCKRPDC